MRMKPPLEPGPDRCCKRPCFEPSNPTSSWRMPQPVAWTAHRFDGRLVPPRAESRGTALRHSATSVDAASTRWQAVANGSTWCPRRDELSPYSLVPAERRSELGRSVRARPAARRPPAAGCYLQDRLRMRITLQVDVYCATKARQRERTSDGWWRPASVAHSVLRYQTNPRTRTSNRWSLPGGGLLDAAADSSLVPRCRALQAGARRSLDEIGTRNENEVPRPAAEGRPTPIRS